MQSKYFWDSYAIIELLKKNPAYLKYENYPIIITINNLAEIYYSLLKNLGKSVADDIWNLYRTAVVKIHDEIIKEAMEFRSIHYPKKNISYTDAIGYIYAKNNNLTFLTGDMEFKNLPNVEFVSK